MKKILIALLTVFVLIASVGCGQSAPNATEETSPVEAEEQVPSAGQEITMWRIGTASMTGNSFTRGSQIAQLINDKVDGMEAAAQATGGSSDNCYLLNEKEIEIGLVNCTSAIQAKNGLEGFEGNPIASMRSIGIYALGVIHIIVNDNAKVTQISDLTGKTIAVGPMGGGTETATDFVLSQLGVTDYKKIYGSMSEALDAVKLGEAAAVLYEATVGAANITDALNSGNCHLMGMTKEEATLIHNNSAEYNVYAIEGGTYDGHAEDIYTIQSPSFFLTREDISEESVYTITKVIYENYDYLVSQNALFRNMRAELVADGMAIPLHPGAERYFKEIGVLK